MSAAVYSDVDFREISKNISLLSDYVNEVLQREGQISHSVMQAVNNQVMKLNTFFERNFVRSEDGRFRPPHVPVLDLELVVADAPLIFRRHLEYLKGSVIYNLYNFLPFILMQVGDVYVTQKDLYDATKEAV